MKRKRVFLILTMILVMGTIFPAVFADAALTEERFRGTGKYAVAASGVGLKDSTYGGITLDIPTTDNCEVIAAYLYWSGYDSIDGDDEIEFEGSPVDVLDWYGPDLWFSYYDDFVYVADVTNEVDVGNNEYTVSLVDEFDLNFGAGLVAVYQKDDLPLSEVIILDGLDNFFFGWSGSRGPNSQVTSFTFDPVVSSVNAEMTLIAAGTEHNNRPNEIWTATGSGDAPLPTDDLIPSPSPSIPPDGDYPLVGNNGASWDTYVADVPISAGDEWAAVQVESVDTGMVGEEPEYYGRGTSGLLIAGVFVIPTPTRLDGLSPGFWKHNIGVYLGYNPGNYSRPHEGEPKITPETLEDYLEDIGYTALEAYTYLTAKGKGSAIDRLYMANLLNAAAGYNQYSD